MRILLLGGASELGLAIVGELMADQPADVVLAGRPGSRHREAAIESIREAGAASVRWLDFDAADPAGHPAVIQAAFDQPVDVAIVAFGVLDDPTTWLDHAATVRLAQTNYVGALSVGALLAQQMRAQGHGQIIALSSVAGERTRRSNFVYGSSKAGMDGYYLQLGVALKDSGVNVLVVRPGAVNGRMTAGRRRVPMSVTPQQVARATVEAMRRGKAMIRVPAGFGPLMAVYRNLPAGLASRLF
ncbi:MAG: decaprenylphospho-beta-D-erythro-pentofuranosid-2-ulose 2-reductase [Propionibacterium sp.]|jgi:decaprenylphospho-beta-D-erythro-pentofuranosid-2-ulose 2-reductase|uniref:decaprenylphospho-beta-D-erythro-pentofuranosid- 2-ulose 2-reductase n=1 Tax=Brooklawnia propionicigenes TaxID=3041175 RepID=UPI00257481AA|nr:decaprenylphospho-beta-D-erythro-pentofuranosid-2-ulose 2-reductase [Brooklawnia sp. SH051]MEA5120265.1 decaprenylphospho-beta-D-erythro-pentofuranosid-2-ulose 2-reductase [Propionibacterium sp.]